MFSFLNSNTLQNAYPPSQENVPAYKLGYNSNNRYPDFPPLMQDGRSVISSWQPESVINDRIIQYNNIKSNWQYRRFLTDHSKELIEKNLKEAENDTGFTVITSDYIAGTPYIYKSLEDDRPVFGVDVSDLKEVYLTREQLESRKIAPAITQAELIKNFGINLSK